MRLKSEIKRYRLNFKNPAGTSRGVYHTKDIYIIMISDGVNIGYGEAAPLIDLSYDDIPNYYQVLSEYLNRLDVEGVIDYDYLSTYPSMLFAIECAMRNLKMGSIKLWDTPFSRGEDGISINGLIWMGSKSEMLKQIESKIQIGFRCLKMKIGAIDFDQELSILNHIRGAFSKDELEIRVDANGAFLHNEVQERLTRLSEYDIHSIEQPIKAGDWERMAELSSSSPIPIALDEELIGITSREKKESLISTIKPQYIILKPSLHGGIYGCDQWIEIANKFDIPWWATSALESNIGLNAIAQWSASHNPTLPQGLGTGALYTNNIDSPLELRGDKLWFDNSKKATFTTIK
ncbi:MAG: o-succinylbenzoate synthase [Bacteroidales bacterium]